MQEEKRREMQIGGERKIETQKSLWLLPSEHHPLHGHWFYWVPCSPAPKPCLPHLFHFYLYSLHIYTENGGSKFLYNVGIYLTNYMVSHSRLLQS